MKQLARDFLAEEFILRPYAGDQQQASGLLMQNRGKILNMIKLISSFVTLIRNLCMSQFRGRGLQSKMSELAIAWRNPYQLVYCPANLNRTKAIYADREHYPSLVPQAVQLLYKSHKEKPFSQHNLWLSLQGSRIVNIDPFSAFRLTLVCNVNSIECKDTRNFTVCISKGSKTVL